MATGQRSRAPVRSRGLLKCQSRLNNSNMASRFCLSVSGPQSLSRDVPVDSFFGVLALDLCFFPDFFSDYPFVSVLCHCGCFKKKKKHISNISLCISAGLLCTQVVYNQQSFDWDPNVAVIRDFPLGEKDF